MDKNAKTPKNVIISMKAPAFMMLVIGVGNFAYRREDGIYIVPIGCLKN
ncbi:MAG: hypothetical protein ACI39Q_03305 [Wujia sp.]